jgi:hypothetical protein
MLPARLTRERDWNEMETTTIEAPGISFPAMAALVDAREKYLQSNEEASALEAKLARLELDESEVLNDIGTDEESQCKRLAEVRIRKDVQARRTSHKRLEVSRVLGEFEGAYKPAETELSAAQSLEFTRRQEVLYERVMGVLGLTSEDWQAVNGIELAVLSSPFLTALRACSPNPNALSVSIEQRANDLIEQADKLRAELEKSI